ncbi:MAG: sulfurtransferase-like selenium metabolism protein YedF, partial [candidate division WOR-3 bacterium]
KPETKRESVFLIASDTIGQGSDELGKILIKVFFNTLLETDPKPERLIFMNNGVKLTTEGSELLDSLNKLTKQGVELLVCGTCLDYFGLKEKVKVGRISNFFEITEVLINTEKVVRL